MAMVLPNAAARYHGDITLDITAISRSAHAFLKGEEREPMTLADLREHWEFHNRTEGKSEKTANFKV